MVGTGMHQHIRTIAGLPTRPSLANINNAGEDRTLIYRIMATSTQRITDEKVIDWTYDYLRLLRETGEDTDDIYDEVSNEYSQEEQSQDEEEWEQY